MKYSLIIPILFSCNLSFGQQVKSEPVIGKPILYNNLLIAEFDFPNRMRWNDAKLACANLGEGWRLPTKDELNFLCQNKDKIPNFNLSDY
jgi:hypothetical protein